MKIVWKLYKNYMKLYEIIWKLDEIGMKLYENRYLIKLY